MSPLQLRSYIRQRGNLIRSGTVHVQRMQKALTQMNVQLHRVITDITGLTGLAIIRAIVAGERDPQVLAALKNGRIKSTASEIAAALTGDYRPEHIFVLQQELQLYEVYQAQITACDLEIEKCLVDFTAQVDVASSPLLKPKNRRKKPPGNAPKFDLRTHLYRSSGVDFTKERRGSRERLPQSIPEATSGIAASKAGEDRRSGPVEWFEAPAFRHGKETNNCVERHAVPHTRVDIKSPTFKYGVPYSLLPTPYSLLPL